MPLRPDPASVTATAATVADKIRALHRAGYSRSEIAALLGKRYQHVRNVLVDDQRRASIPPARQVLAGGVAEGEATFERPPNVDVGIRLEVSPDGQMRLPASVMEALGVVRGGGIKVCVEDDGSVSLLGAPQALKRIQALLGLPLSGVSLVDELIAERRAEVEREDRDG
jgi:hypothetical protein